MKRFALVFVAAFGILVLALAGRTVGFRSRQIAPQPAAALSFEQNRALAKLSRAIQFRTVSHNDPARNSAGEFTRLHDFLRDAFPLVHKHLDREIVGGGSLLYTWRGNESALKPLLLMAHLDVVPADENGWRHPPFSGAIVDGFVWGRGAMDDKASVLAIFEAVERLLVGRFQPLRTVYLAFGHDEEVGGQQGAKQMAELLRSRGVALEFIVDEGLNILEGIVPGLVRPVALVGIAEKGYVSLRLTARAPAGHSSIPPAETAIGILSNAIRRLENSPFPSRVSGATRQMLEFLGPEMSWSSRLALANLWLFDPLVRRSLAQSPLTNATIRTTIAPTLVHAGTAENVLPAEASALINLRLLPGDSIAAATERVTRTVSDPRIGIAAVAVPTEASGVAPIDGPAFRIMQQTVHQVAPDALVAPGLLVSATDSRHYATLTPNIFRFLPITLRADDARRYHGVDERISFEDYERCVRFYGQLIRNVQP